MRSVAEPRPDHVDLLTVEVDPSAPPADWDREIARLLIHLVRRKQSRTTPTAPAAGSSFSSTPEHRKEQTL